MSAPLYPSGDLHRKRGDLDFDLFPNPLSRSERVTLTHLKPCLLTVGHLANLEVFSRKVRTCPLEPQAYCKDMTETTKAFALAVDHSQNHCLH